MRCLSALYVSSKEEKMQSLDKADAEDASCSCCLVGLGLHPVHCAGVFFNPLQFTWTSTQKMLV